MKLLLFLKKLEQSSFLSSYCTICFLLRDNVYPLLFFSLLSQKVQRLIEGNVERLDLELQEQAQILSKLEIYGFLGTTDFYWLGNISMLPVKKKKFWFEYINCYKGPHILGFCINEREQAELKKDCLCVTMDIKIDQEGFEKLALFFNKIQSGVLKNISKPFFSYGATIALDKACLLLQYGQLLGNNTKQFCDEWLPILIDPEQSLFKVSEYFLAKRVKEFFSLWSKIGLRYPEVFWIAFWSDILWRSYHYTNLKKSGKSAEAKQLGFKLPFAFLKWDWKKADPEELKQMHQFLYIMDYNLKNGVGSYYIELLYIKFFLGQFSPQDIQSVSDYDETSFQAHC
ncbi:hypothetical protein E3J79_01600 [Candidatus Dependentiae bacterium]|nr:MAG: hypothetical protein E3J79_01600 [Candidatus Dependentiae bacterium]